MWAVMRRRRERRGSGDGNWCSILEGDVWEVGGRAELERVQRGGRSWLGDVVEGVGGEE
jgi:hypothetical protein